MRELIRTFNMDSIGTAQCAELFRSTGVQNSALESPMFGHFVDTDGVPAAKVDSLIAFHTIHEWC
jgi:hypothetical protein